MDLTVEGYQPPPGESAGAALNAVSPGYFKTMGIPLLAGREFDSARRPRHGASRRDGRTGSRSSTRPSRSATSRALNPIGRRIGIGDNPGTPTAIEIVGLVKDTRYGAIREDQSAQVFFPYLQSDDREPDGVRPHGQRSLRRDEGDQA